MNNHNIINFNYYEYINNYEDIRFLSYIEAYKHYIDFGFKENRTYNTNNLENFNYKLYIDNNEDLENISRHEAYLHWIRYGKYESRKTPFTNDYIKKIDNIEIINDINNELTKDTKTEKTLDIINSQFNYYEYINNYEDLRFMNYEEAYKHYIQYGHKENRICNTENLKYFNYKFYIDNNEDLKHLNENEAYLHWIRYGKYESRIAPFLYV